MKFVMVKILEGGLLPALAGLGYGRAGVIGSRSLAAPKIARITHVRGRSPLRRRLAKALRRRLEVGFFVGVGTAKCGTTWLSMYLRRHPEVFIPSLKELHVFDALYAHDHEKLRLGDRIRKLEEAMAGAKHGEVLDRALVLAILRSRGRLYRPFFEYRRGSKAVYGEFTPGYSAIGEKGYAAIRQQFPEAKLIFMMRNPVDRLWSHIRHEERQRKKLRGDDPSRGALDVMRRSLHAPADYTVRRGDYAAALQALDAVFPKEQLFTIFYEDLFGPDGQEVITQLTNFLGIASRQANFRKPANAAPRSERLPPEVRAEAISILWPVYRYAADRFGSSLPASWRRDMELPP